MIDIIKYIIRSIKLFGLYILIYKASLTLTGLNDILWEIFWGIFAIIIVIHIESKKYNKVKYNHD